MKEKKSYESLEKLKSILTSVSPGHILFVGLGNRLRGDDAAGLILVEMLAKHTSFSCIDAEGGLENHLGSILSMKPEILIIIDAVHLGKHPGEVAILTSDELLHQVSSTHDISLRMLLDLLQQQRKSMKIFIAGIQPVRLEIGASISSEVSKAISTLAHAIIDESSK